MRTSQTLQNRAGSTHIHRDSPACRVRIRLERWCKGGKGFSLILHIPAGKHCLNNFQTLAHHYRGPDLFALLAFTDLFHEDLRRAETQKKTSFAGNVLQYACFHCDLNGMTRIWGNDSPPNGYSRRLACNHCRHRSRRASFHRMLAPPGVCFGEPEGIKASRIARSSHGEGLFHRFHAELQNSDTKGYGHRIYLLPKNLYMAGAHRAPLQFRTPTVGAVYERVNELKSRKLFPSSRSRSGRAINKMDPFRNGAAGVVSSAKLFRPEDFAELTTRLRRFRWLRNFQLMPQPPLLCEEGNTPHSTFLSIRSHLL